MDFTKSTLSRMDFVRPMAPKKHGLGVVKTKTLLDNPWTKGLKNFVHQHDLLKNPCCMPCKPKKAQVPQMPLGTKTDVMQNQGVNHPQQPIGMFPSDSIRVQRGQPNSFPLTPMSCVETVYRCPRNVTLDYTVDNVSVERTLDLNLAYRAFIPKNKKDPVLFEVDQKPMYFHPSAIVEIMRTKLMVRFNNEKDHIFKNMSPSEIVAITAFAL